MSAPTPDTPRQRRAAPRPPRAGADLLDTSEAAYLLGVSIVTLAHWRMTGTGPAFVRPANRIVRYRRQDLLAWLGEPVASTKAADASSAPR